LPFARILPGDRTGPVSRGASSSGNDGITAVGDVDFVSKNDTLWNNESTSPSRGDTLPASAASDILRLTAQAKPPLKSRPQSATAQQQYSAVKGEQ
jgi:hypothetical protein